MQNILIPFSYNMRTMVGPKAHVITHRVTKMEEFEVPGYDKMINKFERKVEQLF
jgi:hypothetical protein